MEKEVQNIADLSIITGNHAWLYPLTINYYLQLLFFMLERGPGRLHITIKQHHLETMFLVYVY